ncbi:DNA cytosine methyltransferase [Spiroplasma endosymbiont of Nebria brevicollis]|uniref:DNA cytosine methyltransferase n=1 Tax=Spiroplasma endosymbiont of Nebria brevicollis TaxID=3066284 RepID=UPI00313E67EB
MVTHDNGNTFKVITDELKLLGYIIPHKPLVIDSLNLGIPMYRKRIYIPAIRSEFINSNSQEMTNYITKLIDNSKLNINIWDVISENKVENKYYLQNYQLKIINMWDEFYKKIDIKIIGFPIWADVFLKRTLIHSLFENKK